MVESMFAKLFRYARSAEADQLENFATEALAVAIRTDPLPFYSALARRGLIPSVTKSAVVAITTQEVVTGVGVIDLVARSYVDRGLDREVWVEVKVWAQESGDQLARYRSALVTRSDAHLCSLVTLGPRPITTDPSVPWLSWQALRDEVAGSATPPASVWVELSTFLQEMNVADESNEPVSAREAASLRDAHSLFRKASRVLTEVSELGKERWPAWMWGNKDQVTQLVLGQFHRHARYTLNTTSRPFYLILGYTDLHLTGEAHLTGNVNQKWPHCDEAGSSRRRCCEGRRQRPLDVPRHPGQGGDGLTHRPAALES